MGFFGKVLVVVAVIAVAFFGWRWWQRMEAERLARSRGSPPAQRDDKPVAPRTADDLRRCPVCDDYVSINARRCDRPTCPRG